MVVFGDLKHFNEELIKSAPVALGSRRKSRRKGLWGKLSWRTDVRRVFKDAYELVKRRMEEKVKRESSTALLRVGSRLTPWEISYSIKNVMTFRNFQIWDSVLSVWVKSEMKEFLNPNYYVQLRLYKNTLVQTFSYPNKGLYFFKKRSSVKSLRFHYLLLVQMCEHFLSYSIIPNDLVMTLTYSYMKVNFIWKF